MGEATADREPIDGISERKRARVTGAQTGRDSRQRADWSELHDGAGGTVGLKLETTKGPVDFLVIDRIERPSAN